MDNRYLLFCDNKKYYKYIYNKKMAETRAGTEKHFLRNVYKFS